MVPEKSVCEPKLPDGAPALPSRGNIGTAAGAGAEPLPEWKVSGIFSSHMVLQRGRPVRVHGWCAHPGAAVTGDWSGEKVRSAVQADGSFALTFAARPASFDPTVLTVSSDYGTDVFEDVLVGDVWMIGGQSNADLTLAPCLVKTPEIEAALSDDDPFRLFTQTQAAAMGHTEHHAAPSRDIIEPGWHWQRPDAAAAKAFSALGYYFARLLAPRIGVPVGVVMMAAGGACLRELMPAELAAARGYATGANVPVAGYYNTLIAPLLGLQFCGQVFFQGESEGIWKNMAMSYADDLAEFVADERRRFGFDFPFYNIQLCSYRSEGQQYFPYLEWVRGRQFDAMKKIPDYHLAVCRDLGALPADPDFAHSPYKYELARRVAGLVLAYQYGRMGEEEANSPMPLRAEPKPGGIGVTFRWVNGGLRTRTGLPPIGFALLMPDDRLVPALARITGPETVWVEVPAGLQPRGVAFAMTPQAGDLWADLCGGTGLPVPAFTMEC